MNDLERTIEKLEKRVEELKKDNEILIKEIDRLSEYNTNLERMMKK
jgi:prefoldin subunit 5|tara:strand:- start:201 stop:338 length:138 start_codon:yes stop_codon:yes gene_type:complete